MDNLKWKTVEEINLGIASRIKVIRKRKKISQNKLSTISNVSFASIRRFEKTGNISLYSLTKICFALEIENEIDKLFCITEYKSIEEVINDK